MRCLLPIALHERVANDGAGSGSQRSLSRVLAYIGAPRPMKMGTIASPWRYDAIAGDTLQLASLGCSAIQHYASWIPIWVVRFSSIAEIPSSLRDRREGPEADIHVLCDLRL